MSDQTFTERQLEAAMLDALMSSLNDAPEAARERGGFSVQCLGNGKFLQDGVSYVVTAAEPQNYLIRSVEKIKLQQNSFKRTEFTLSVAIGGSVPEHGGRDFGDENCDSR